MRAVCRKQQQHQRQHSRQPRNTSGGSSSTSTATACLVTLLSGGRGSMALSLSAYTSRSRALHPSAAAGIAPAFAARASSSLDKRSYHDRRSGSLVAVGAPAMSGEGRHMRGISEVSMSSVAGWSRSRQQQQLHPRLVGLGGNADGGFFLGPRGRRPAGGGHRRRSFAISATTTGGGGRFDAAELLKMSYRDLQKLAKDNNVRANQKGEAIVNDLVTLGPATDGGLNGDGEYGGGSDDLLFPGAAAKEAASDWVTGVLDEDIMAGVDLSEDDSDVDDDDKETYDQAVKRATSGKSTATDMEGLKGGVDQGDGWVTFKLGKGDELLGLDGEDFDDGDYDDDEEDQEDQGGNDSMDARLRDAAASRLSLSPEMMASSAEEFGFGRDTADLQKLTITVPEGCCPGCGSKFQSDDADSPGYLQLDKLEQLLAKTAAPGAAAASAGSAAENEVDMDPEAWLEAQSDINTDLDFDLDLDDLEDDHDDGSGGDDVLEDGGGGPQRVEASASGLGRASRDAKVLEGREPAVSSTSAAVLEGSGEIAEQLTGWGTVGSEADFGEEEEEEEKLVVCQRCYRLRNYGSVEDALRPGFSDSDLLTPQRFLELLGSIRKQRCLIIYLVDLFDFHGTFLYNLPRITGNNPVLVAGNKVDLLPKDLKKQRVTKWVRDKCRESGLPNMEMRDVHLVSCKHGVGIASLMRKAREQALRGNRDIYVLGAANVGKSTFINNIIEDRGNNGGGDARRKSGGKGSKPPVVAGRGVTVSSVPGTTLDFLKVDLGDKRSLYDTPGLLLPHTLTSRLTAEELRAAIPKKKVDHVTFRLGEGKAVLMGGLARVEVVTGRPFLLTFFVSNDVRLHPTDTRRVDDMLSQHVGKGQMIFPPFEPERLEELGALAPTDFDIVGAGWREAAADVVIAGLGWISVTGAGPVTLRVWAPRGVLVMAREPLLPYESWETTAKFTGGATVKKGRKKQGRRA
eukprot:g19362.t1